MSAPRGAGAWRLNVRRLAELDMASLGPSVIIAEFALGVIACLGLGAASLAYAVRIASPAWSWPVLLGLELVAIGINYVPLLMESLRLRSDSERIAAAKAAIKENPAEVRSYGVRQAWLLVPGAVVGFATWDRTQRPAE